MCVEGDDVLVGRLRVVLAGGAEVRQMEVQLGAVAGGEEAPELLVTLGRPPIRLREARDLVGGLAHAKLVEGRDEGRRVHPGSVDPERRRLLEIVSDEGGTPGRHVVLDLFGIADLGDVEGAEEVVRLRRGRFLPVARRDEPDELRFLACLDDDRRPGLGQRRPVLEMGRRPERPVLVVGERPLLRRAGVEDDRVEAALAQDLGGALGKRGDVRAMQVGEGLFVHTGRS